MSSLSKSAHEYSVLASQALRDQKYSESIGFYQQAVNSYLGTDGKKVVELCKAAGCLRNMGAIHRLIKSYRRASICWTKADEFYRRCQTKLVKFPSESQAFEEQICLEAIVAELTHARVRLLKSMKDYGTAIQCCSILLSQLQTSLDAPKSQTVIDKVAFVPMAEEDLRMGIVQTLESLGDLHLLTGSYEESQGFLETALQMVDSRKMKGCNERTRVRILQNIASVFLQKGDVNRAYDRLETSVEILEAMDQQWSLEAMALMDRIGRGFEELGQFDFALPCFEKALLARSRYYGNSHVQVARSLISVGRIMELQGNSLRSLEVYSAAKAIFAAQVTSSSFNVAMDDAEKMLSLIPLMIEQARYGEAVAYLNKCIEATSSLKEGTESTLDMSQVYFLLGQAYFGLQDHVSSIVCLVEASKAAGGVPQKDILTLLRHIESMEGGRPGLNARSISYSTSGSFSEDGVGRKSPDQMPDVFSGLSNATPVHGKDPAVVARAASDAPKRVTTVGTADSTMKSERSSGNTLEPKRVATVATMDSTMKSERSGETPRTRKSKITVEQHRAPQTTPKDERLVDVAPSLDLNFSGPLQYVTLPSKSFDDGVSQITNMIVESKSSSSSPEWWEGWFPTNYVSQAVEAAEVFLQARGF